jgi:urease accessory protein
MIYPPNVFDFGRREIMLVQLGATVREETSAFQPESGAYGGGHRYGHAETFSRNYLITQQLYSDHCVHSDHQRHQHLHSHDDFHSDEHS